MWITYDQNVDALYIRFNEAPVTTKHLRDGYCRRLRFRWAFGRN